MSTNTKSLSQISRKAAVVAVCFFMLFAQTGCFSSFLKVIAETDAEDLVTDFINAYLKDPEACKYSKYCSEDIEPEFTDEQLEIFFELTSDVEFKVKNTLVNDSRSKADVQIQFSNTYDLEEFDMTSGTVEDYLDKADKVGSDTFVVKFSLKKNKNDDWIITDMDDFADLLMTSYTDIRITDGTEPDPVDPLVIVPNIGNDSISEAELVANAYIYSTWFNVEVEFPLDDNSIDSEDAYAIMNVFYFSTPINGTFNAVLLDNSGKALMSNDFKVNDEVTVKCDFSAGFAGWTVFDPGVYHVELYYDGNLIATSEDFTVK